MIVRRLSGWWRLWIVVTGIWAVIVIAGTASNWPQSNPFSRDPYAAALPQSKPSLNDYLVPDTATTNARRRAVIGAFLIWAIPSGGIVGLTFVSLWVWRGFQRPTDVKGDTDL